MILSHILRSRLSLVIFLICVFIPLVIFIYMFVGMFEDDFKPNDIVVNTKKKMFDKYLKRFNKSYSGAEYLQRLSNFMESLREISRLNRITGAVHGLTQFSDMSKEEFSKMTGSRRRLEEIGDIMDYCLDNRSIRIDHPSGFNSTDDLPHVLDWRNKGVIGPVLDQKKCGGCWAFSTIGLVESMSLIQEVEKTYTRRSIQELIDCTEYCNGCMGGNVGKALEFLCTKKVPIPTEDKYPLILIDQNCSASEDNEGRRIKQYWVYYNLNEVMMQYFLVKHGPLAVVVNADPWMHYMGGIIQRACYRSKDNFVMDHVVQLVGYDKSGSVPYYIARNSWGTKFGIEGYVKLVMNKNICGVSEEVALLEVY